MINLIGTEVGGSNKAIRSVIEQAVATGADEPAWVAVEDSQGAWVREAAASPPAERARAVIAVCTDAALVQAIRLGIGGALWLPPSTVDAGCAFRAAAEVCQGVTPPLDPWIADLVSAPEQRLIAVTWKNRAFWRCQVGERRMATLLAELAVELGALPVVLPWPAVLLPVAHIDDIHRTWAGVTDREGAASEGVTAVFCGPWEGHCGAAAVAMTALAKVETTPSETPQTGFPASVWELPTGRQVGAWAPTEAWGHTGIGWLATPGGPTAQGFSWRLVDPSGEEGWVEDVLSTGAEAGSALRVPGWCASVAGAGRPAGLLVERLAADALRRGVPLWVPNVDQALLQFLLRLPGVFWVDGPAVPEPQP